jgi:hypothetical protein
MERRRSDISPETQAFLAQIIERPDPIGEAFTVEPRERFKSSERKDGVGPPAGHGLRNPDDPRSASQFSRVSPETEAFLARVTGAPSRLDTATFVAAITGQDAPARADTPGGTLFSEHNFNPNEPRDEHGRWTTGSFDDSPASAAEPGHPRHGEGPSGMGIAAGGGHSSAGNGSAGPAWSPELAARTGWVNPKSVPDGRCTGIDRGRSNKYFEQQTWHFGEGDNERKVELRVVKKGTVVVYLTHWRSPDQRAREKAIVGNPNDGAGAGRCVYLSCWGNEYNKDLKTGIPGFPDLHGMLGYGDMTRAQERVGREYGLDVSMDSINGGKGPSKAAFDGVMDKAWKASTDLGKQMSLANEAGKPTDTHAWRCCPNGVDVILVGGVPGVGDRYNKGVHFNSDGVPSPIKEKDLLNWNTY